MTAPTASIGVRQRFWLWSVVVVVLLTTFAVGVVPRLHLETNILSLLPSNTRDPGVDRAVARFVDQLGSHVLILIGAHRFDDARSGAQALGQQLQDSGVFKKVRWTVDAGWLQQAAASYAPYQARLLSTQTRAWLRSGNQAALLSQARRALYSPAALMRRSDAASDPLDLFGAFLEQTVPAAAGKLNLRNGVLTVADGGTHYVLVRVKLRGKAFAASEGDKVAPVLDSAFEQARKHGLTVLASGVVLHAIAAADESKAQLLHFGLVQALGLLLLLWWAFRSWRVPALALATLVVGFIAAFAACHVVFGRVHVLTLVFGCNFIGVAVDFCMYFCSDQFRAPEHWRPPQALRSVGGAITVGMIVSVLTYGVLATTPFPGLRQMGLFCGVGLLAAWACVLCWYPRLLKPAPQRVARHHGRVFEAADRRFTRAVQSLTPALRVAVIGVVALGAIVGLARLQFQDDVRVLQDTPARLVKQDQAVGRLLGEGMDRRFFLVRGVDAQAVLERSEALDTRLRKLKTAGAIAGFSSVSQALPSVQRQRDNHRLLAKTVYHGRDGLLARFMQKLGFSASTIQHRLANFHANHTAPLTLAQWLPSAAARPFRHLWLGQLGGGPSAAVTTLAGVQDGAALPQAADGLPGVRLIDPTANVSTVLGTYRARILWLTAAACVLAGLLLFAYFRRWRDWPLALAPALTVLLTVAILGLAGVGANLFNGVALLLVLGLSVDYAIFTQRGRVCACSMLLPVSLAAAASLLAFGMLALSSTPFVRSLGVTVVVGVVTGYCVCWVLGKERGCE